MARDCKPPLYRSVNTRTHGVRHGGDYRHGRACANEADAPMRGTMHGGRRLGRAHPVVPLPSIRVGQPWDTVYSKAKARLDGTGPIAHVVAPSARESHALARVGESSYVGGLHVDDDGRLQRVVPQLSAAQMRPFCACCTPYLRGPAVRAGL